MKPYTAMYRRWITVPGVGAAEIAVLSGLYARADADGVCADAVQEELAAELGKSRPWLSAVLTRLQDPAAGLVEARRKRGFRGIVYALAGATDPDTGGQRADRTRQPADVLLESGNPSYSSSPGAGEGVRKSDPLAQDWQPAADDLAWAAQARPDVDPAAVTRKFVAWCRKANSRNGYTPADPGAAWRRWMARELVAPAFAPVPSPSPALSEPALTPTLSDSSPRHDRQPSDLPRRPRPDLASRVRNEHVLAALRDRLARPA